MDGWSPTYRAERVKVIGRLINLTPNQNWRRVARPFRKKLVEEVTRPLSNAVDARGSAEKRAIFITKHLNPLDQAKSPTHCQFSDRRLASASLQKRQTLQQPRTQEAVQDFTTREKNYFLRFLDW